MVILLIPYVSLEITKALDYYLYVTSCTFSIVWSSFYTLNILRSNGIKGQITEELQVKHYTQSGIAGRSTSGGITCEYKGMPYIYLQLENLRNFTKYMVTL